ncbi:MAG: hypothetical protein JWM33_4002 [Caulobacteraceae bacterium]|nr:hypothetical protein [Caulobacteraceae bacterium]
MASGHVLAAAVTVSFALVVRSATAQSPLATLPSTIIGVIGSGDQLALKLGDGEGQRVLKPGDSYAGDWILKSLTDSVATFSRDGQVQAIGLNPSGALAAAVPASPPSSVTVLTPEDAALLDRLRAEKHWNGKADTGLSISETQRLLVLEYRARDATPSRGGPYDLRQLVASMGEAGHEYEALVTKRNQAVYQLSLDAFQQYGPVSWHVGPGEDALAAERAAGLPVDDHGMLPGGRLMTTNIVKDSAGAGQTVTLSAPASRLLQPVDYSTPRPAPPPAQARPNQN